MAKRHSVEPGIYRCNSGKLLNAGVKTILPGEETTNQKNGPKLNPEKLVVWLFVPEDGNPFRETHLFFEMLGIKPFKNDGCIVTTETEGIAHGHPYILFT